MLQKGYKIPENPICPSVMRFLVIIPVIKTLHVKEISFPHSLVIFIITTSLSRFLTLAIFKSFLSMDSYDFPLTLSPKHFIFKETHGKDSDKPNFLLYF